MHKKRIYGTWWQALLIFGIPFGYLLITDGLGDAIWVIAVGILGGALGAIIVFGHYIVWRR